MVSPRFLRPLLCSLLLSVMAGGMGFALLMQHRKETFAVRWDTHPELWDWLQEAPEAALFALLLGAAVGLVAQRFCFCPTGHGCRWLSGLLTAWGLTLLMPLLGAWNDACQGIDGPGHLPMTMVLGGIAGLLMAAEALIAALFCALSRPLKGYRA